MMNSELVLEPIKISKPVEPKTNAKQTWINLDDYSLCKHTFGLLLNNQIPFIRIPNFATPAECEKLVEQASVEGFSPYRGVEPQINRIGNTVFEYNNISKDMYFRENEEAIQIQQ